MNNYAELPQTIRSFPLYWGKSAMLFFSNNKAFITLASVSKP
jgi:hypothetical protein